MQLRFECGGGVTGPAGNRSANFDTARMPPAEVAEFQALVQAADLPGLVGRAARDPFRPDEISYEITIEQDGHTQTISATHRDMPPGLRSLITWLSAHALRSV
jgi:hypothetical protein